jgi:hypothetical protein
VNAWTVLFFLVAAGVGLGLLGMVGSHFAILAAALASGSGSVPELLALHGPRTETVGAAAVAADSLSQLVELAALTCAMVAALMLLIGAGLALQPRRRRSAHRIATTGLWMALGVALAAMLPIEGYPFSAAPSAAGVPAQVQWHLGWKVLALSSVAGLLLSSITAPNRRHLHPHWRSRAAQD